MIYAGCLLILVGLLFLRRPSAFYVESSGRRYAWRRTFVRWFRG